MRVIWKAIALAIPLSFLAACGQSGETGEGVGTKLTYSLCPTADDSRQKLFELVKAYTGHQDVRLVDRGAEAQRELSGMESDALRTTDGELILLTIEKSGEYRISITNLGLKEKVALTTRFWGEGGGDSSVQSFLDDLRRFWRFEEVDGGVDNDPAC